jgi:hypothetical protein
MTSCLTTTGVGASTERASWLQEQNSFCTSSYRGPKVCLLPGRLQLAGGGVYNPSCGL